MKLQLKPYKSKIEKLNMMLFGFAAGPSEYQDGQPVTPPPLRLICNILVPVVWRGILSTIKSKTR